VNIENGKPKGKGIRLRSVSTVIFCSCGLLWLGQPGVAIAAEPPAEETSDARSSKPTPRIRPGWFHLDFDAAYLELESDSQWRTVQSSRFSGSTRGFNPFRRVPRDAKQRNRDLRFTESLGLSLHGDIIDPNLIDWSANFSFGLLQGEFREQVGGLDRRDSDSGILTEFDLSMNILKSKPISMHAYARRSVDRIARRFLPSLRERQTETGVSVLALTGPVTTEIGFALNDVDRTGNVRIEDNEALTSQRFSIDSKWQISDRHSLRLQYVHENQKNRFQGSNFNFDVIRDELRLEHELAFGPDKKHLWDTFIRANSESGSLARNEFEAYTRLALRHTDKFRTSVRYGFFRYDQFALRVDLHKFDLEALFQPTKNLRFTIDGFYLNEAVKDDVETDQFGAGFDASYRRPNALGEFTANLSLQFDRATLSGGSGRRIVRDEAHALDDVRPVVLRETRIDALSLVVHNLGRTRIYVSGVDYITVFANGRTLIRRIQTGRVAQGEVVYCDYSYRTPTDAQIDTVRTDLLLEHPFTMGLTPYYYFESRAQDANGSEGIPVLRDNMNRQRLGVRYGKNRWNVSAEFELFDDTVEPYDAFHLTGRWNIIRTAEHSFDFSGEYSAYRFKGGLDKRRVGWLDFNLTDRWQLNPYTALNTTASYRREDDSIDGITDGIDLEVALAYTRNYLSMELVMEYDLLSIDRNMDEGLGVFVRIRRDLGHLLPKRRGVQ